MDKTIKLFILLVLFISAYFVNIRYLTGIDEFDKDDIHGIKINLMFTLLVLFGWILGLDMLRFKSYLGGIIGFSLLVVFTVIAFFECKKIREKA